MKDLNEQNLQTLQSVMAEVERFKERLTKAIKRVQMDDGCYQRKEIAAAKRAALDLKRELTNVTQMKSY